MSMATASPSPSSTRPSRLRCAVYTRKSSEEGLEQEFNSLDAQHEACQAYVASQASLGWRLVPDRYDDGGISGGTMERPALKRLLQDISEGRIDVVVVYKIDRLTRSLTDFARIVEIFDRAGASFVSVTQQFNTTTSMGRLTLNVLLSFAQFEREVTAERIRDKIAASKKKGMWMGGQVPLGYRVENRKLLIDEEEAATVRFLFDRYLELKSVEALSHEARRLGLKSSQARPGRESKTFKMQPFHAGGLLYLLANPLYIGKIRHKAQIHDGEHDAIIDQQTFDAVQALLVKQAPARRASTSQPDLHLLTGLIFDDRGKRLRPVHSSKGSQRYRYYVSRTDGARPARPEWRLPADDLDALISHQIGRLLSDQVLIAKWAQDAQTPGNNDPAAAIAKAAAFNATLSAALPIERRQFMRTLIKRVEIETGSLRITFDRTNIISRLTGFPPATARAADHIVECAISERKRGVEKKLVLMGDHAPAHAPDPGLVELLVKARSWLRQLTDGSGTTIAELAAMAKADPSDVSRIFPLAFLSPTIVGDIIMGRQPVNMTAQQLSRLIELPLPWEEQHRLLRV